jgi:hypothetical protein
VLALAVVAGIGAYVYIERPLVGGGDGCGDGAVLRLAAAPEVMPLIERAAIDTAGECSRVAVTPLRAEQTASILADDSLDGWVPASSAWLQFDPAAAGAGPATPASPAGEASEAPADPPPASGAGPVSLVRTPLVVAAPQPLAEEFGWPERQPTWAELTAAVVGGAIPRFSMDSPLRSPTGMLGVLGVHAAMRQTTPDQGIAQLRALTLRSRLADPDADAAALLRQLETMSDPAAAVAEVGAFPATEQALRAYQQRQPTVPLAAIYPGDGLMEADYPLVLTADAAADADRRDVATRLIERFHSASFAATIDEHGFRPAREAANAAPADPPGAEFLAEYPEPAAVPADPALITARATQWAGYQRLEFQTLILVDASASMNDPVRDASGNETTKAGLLRAAGAQAVDLFGLDTSLGLWMFATQTPFSPPFVEVVPFGPLDEPINSVPRREVLRQTAEQYRPFSPAGTPLYETVLRAIDTMQELVRPDAVTMVVVLTDGRDEDSAYAMSRDEFLSELGQTRDLQRPVPVFGIGYGADADIAALEAMAEATGGTSVVSNDPSDLASAISQVFLAAHSAQ